MSTDVLIDHKPQSQEVPGPLEAGGPTFSRRDWQYCGLASVLLLGAYLLLQNGLWWSGPDTALYIGLSRNWLLGRGFQFNGNIVQSVPPGWPTVLAGAMKISSSFAFLSLVPMVCVWLAAALWYWSLRRLLPAKQALAAVLMTGTMFWWYTSAVQLRSEALFSLCLSASVLLAWQVSEGKCEWWRILLLAGACASMAVVRWVGLAAWPVVGAIVLSRQKGVRFNRIWLACALSMVATVGTFKAMQYVVKKVLTPPPVVIKRTGLPPAQQRDLTDESDVADGRMPKTLPPLNPGQLVRQGAGAGVWLSGLLWMPSHLAVASNALEVAVGAVGWILLGACALYIVRSRQWFWMGLLVYGAALVMRWKVIEPRYLMPVAPLALVGVWLALADMARRARSERAGRALRAAATGFVVSVAGCNVVLLAVDVAIARSGNFHHYYFAGENEDLLSVAHYLRGMGVKDGQVAVNAQYINLNRRRTNGYAKRGLAMLTDRVVYIIPRHIGTGQPDEGMVRWMIEKNVRFYAYRPPVSPWRAWHFRIGWIQSLMTGQKEIPENPGWELYEVRDEAIFKHEPPAVKDWPRRVPGL